MMAKKRLYRANWRFSAGKDRRLAPGDTIELTEEEAAPYLGGVLSAVDEKASDEADEGGEEADAEETKAAANKTKKGEGKS